MTYQQDFLLAIELQKDSKLVEAERLFRKLVELQPEHAELVRHWSVVLHELKRFDESVLALKQLCKLCPDDEQARFFLAVSLQMSGHVEEAILELGIAYDLNREDLNIANQYAGILLVQQQYERAIPVFEQIQVLTDFRPEATANLGNALYKAGQITRAMECFSRAVAAKPGYVYAKQMIARCYIKQDRASDAITLLQNLETSSLLTPDGYLLLSSALASQDKLADAIKACQSGIDLQPDNASAWHQLGNLYQKSDLLSDAEAAYHNTISHSASSVDGYVSLAFLLERMTRLEEARSIVNAGLRIDPQAPSLLLINAMVFRREGDCEAAVADLDRLLALDRSIESAHRAMELSSRHSNGEYIAPMVYYELGNSLDRLGRYSEAYAAFNQANVLRSITVQAKRFNKAAYQREVRQLQSLITPELVSTCMRMVEPGKKTPVISPVFLVGFPRSGTTLLGNILDCHPDIQVIDEAPLLGQVQKYLASKPAGYPNALKSLSNADLETIRSLYFDAVSDTIKMEHGELLIDKLPLNLAKVALTKQLFPNAKYILLLRHPCDACLSCFMQNFSPNEAMNNFYSLKDSANLYDLVMRSWTSHSEQLKLPVHQIRYEDVLEDFDTQIEQLLSFLNLPWHAGVTAFDSHARKKESISTPSYYQVTQPIYRHARYRWRHYKKEFDSVLPVLTPWIRRYGYE